MNSNLYYKKVAESLLNCARIESIIFYDATTSESEMHITIRLSDRESNDTATLVLNNVGECKDIEMSAKKISPSNMQYITNILSGIHSHINNFDIKE
jgi:hypothetical protein